MNVVSIDAAQARRVAFTLVAWQGAVTVVVALVSYVIAGRLAAVSALMGGGISTLASLVMAALSFRASTLASPHNAVRGFYVGEAAKVVTVIVLFVWVLRTQKVSPLAMFAAYMATFIVYWLALANALPSMGSPPSSGKGPGGAKSRDEG